MNKLLIAGIGLAGVIGGPAMAADLRPPMAAPVEYFTWSGGYVGVNLGGGWRQPVDFATVVAPCTNPLCVLFLEETAAASAIGTGTGTRGKGITGGFQAGYNYQFGPVVAGVEADWEFFKRTSVTDTVVLRTEAFGFPNTTSVSNEVNSTWLATIRGRLGFAWDRLLVYATGGVAFTDVKYIQTMTATCFGCAAPFTFSATQTSSTSKTQSGGVFGAGAEYALWNSLSVRAEYLYAQFKGVSTSSALVGPPGTVSNPFTGSTGNLRDHIVRIGLNYKFGGGAVVASY